MDSRQHLASTRRGIPPQDRPLSAQEVEEAGTLADARSFYPAELAGEVAAIAARQALAARAESVEREAERQRIHSEARRLVLADEARASFSAFERLSLRDELLRPRESRPALIDGLQMVGHKATLVAQFKTGKTTVTGNVVRSLVDERPLFERFHVPSLDGRVAVFDYELTRDDALDLYRGLGIDRPERVALESLRGTGFTLANDHHAAMAVEFFRDQEIAYWVLDPFGRAMRGFGSENSNDDVRAFLVRIDKIVAEAGVLGVLLPVHTGRAEAEVGSERARGATVLDDDPDVRWLLTRSQEQRFFRAEGRAGVSVPEFALSFDPSSLSLSALDMSRRDVAGQRYTPHVVAHLRSHPGSATREIKAAVAGRDRDVDAALKRLVGEGEVVRVQEGRAHRHYLAGDEPEGTEA